MDIGGIILASCRVRAGVVVQALFVVGDGKVVLSSVSLAADSTDVQMV